MLSRVECIVNTIILVINYPSMLLVLLYALLNLIHASFAVNIYLFTYMYEAFAILIQAIFFKH